MEKYYTPEQMAHFEELRAETPPEEIDPASAEAKAPAARWDALQERTMAHFARKQGLTEAIGRNYAAGSFENIDGAPQAEDLAFIKRVREG